MATQITDSGTDIIIKSGERSWSYPKVDIGTVLLPGIELQVMNGLAVVLRVKTIDLPNITPAAVSLEDLQDKLLDLLAILIGGSGIYQTQLPLNTQTIIAGKTIGDFNGRSISEVLDMLLSGEIYLSEFSDDFSDDFRT